MKNVLTTIIILVSWTFVQNVQAQLLPVLGAQRAGTATAQFLKIGVGARASSMGETFVAVANDASALYWNPAGITQFTSNQVFIAHTNWFVDIYHEFFGAVYHITPYDAVGISITSLHMDDMQVTTEFAPRGNGNYFSVGDFACGVTYSRKMTPQFSFGGTIRYIEETMDVLKMRGVVVDIGTYYWTGLGTSRFSAVLSNFGDQMSPTGSLSLNNGQTVSQFQEYPPPTMFRFGFAFEPIMNERATLTTSIQLNHPNDNSENIAIGAEYGWMKTLYLRAGYKFNVDEQSLSFGLGFNASISDYTLRFDYGYVPYTNLGGVHRISLLAEL